MNMKYLGFEFEMKEKGANLVIEGFANAATVDRAKEKIEPTGWNLDNYKKNPVVLFDHGMDPSFGSMPVGQTVAAEAKPEGLYTKIQLSNSKTEKITAIRDLVGEGILKTFSVGFNPTEIDVVKSDNGDEVGLIKGAELIEVSIVPVPMNQDSTFAVMSKKFTSNNTLARGWLKTKLHKEQLLAKKAWIAAAVYQRQCDEPETFKNGWQFSLSKEARVSLEQINQTLNGDLNPVPSNIVAAISKMLRLDNEFLVNLNQGSNDCVRQIKQRHEYIGQGEVMKTKADQMAAAGDPSANQGDNQSKVPTSADYCLCAVLVPKSSADSVEAAQSWAEGEGYKVVSVDDAGDNWKVNLEGYDQIDSANVHAIDLGDGVLGLVAPEKAAKPGADGQQAQESGADQGKAGDPPAAAAPTGDDAKLKDQQKERASKYGIEVIEGGALTPPSDGPKEDEQYGDPVNYKYPVGDKDHAANAHARFKQDAGAYKQDASKAKVYERIVRAELKFGVKPAYDPNDALDKLLPDDLKKQLEGGEKPAEANDAGKGALADFLKNLDGNDDNPYLMLMKQTNVLLSQVLGATQEMSKKLDGLADLSLKLAESDQVTTAETPPANPEANGSGEGKSVDLMSRFIELKSLQAETNTVLKRMGQ